MFALRHILNKHNRTHKLDDSTLPELGSGAGGGGLEEGSGEELAPASGVWPALATEAHLTTPAPSKTPPAPHTTKPALETKLETVDNDLPERPVDGPAGSVTPPALVPSSGRRGDSFVLQSNLWAQLEEMEGETYSGNGLMELETRHDSLLRTHNSLQASGRGHGDQTGPRGLGLGLGPEEEEDIFQAQGYLPISPRTLRPKVSASTTRSPPTTRTGSPQGVGLLLPLTLDYEGSGSLPQPSNQTL